MSSSEPGGQGGPGGEEAPTGEERSRRRLLMRRLSLVFAILAGVFALLAALSAMSGGQSIDGFHFPASLPDGATVVNAQGGPEAVAAVKHIHWEPEAVVIEKALLVSYSDGTLLWLSAADNACQLTSLMAAKINASSKKLPYTPPVAVRVDHTTVYITLDKRNGQVHAFWCRGKLVAWAQLGVNPEHHDLLAETIKKLVRETSYEG